jgi:GAF domain-containing protein
MPVLQSPQHDYAVIAPSLAMLAAPIPSYDRERLAALREMLILDTPPEERFDKVVQFAAQEFDVPIALISLIDENRQWFKARVGLDVCETSRDISFCGHAILQPDIFVIPDARADQRFADNPIVTGEPYVIFYAGAPLPTRSGFAIGTLCLIDHKPRNLDATELEILSSLRDLLVEELINPAEAPHG